MTDTKDLVNVDSVTFNMPTITKDVINKNAVAKVNEFLPELDSKTKYFDRNNSQSTLSMMSITMLNGQSPMRMMRQIMAEVEKRKMALAEAQVNHAKQLEEIKELQTKLQDDPDNNLLNAKLRQVMVGITMHESKINGSFKDIAVLIDSYNAIKENNGIEDWDEEQFEREEKRHHVRRGFELMYRNLMDGGRASTATIEYMQQYGVHPQVGLAEVQSYMNSVTDRMNNGMMPHANDLEDFLDAIADKYWTNANKTSERIYGKTDTYNTDYMKLLDKKSS